MDLEDLIFPWLLLSCFFSLSVSAPFYPSAVPCMAVGTRVAFLSATSDVRAGRRCFSLTLAREMGRCAFILLCMVSWDSERICLFLQGNSIVSDS